MTIWTLNVFVETYGSKLGSTIATIDFFAIWRINFV